MFIFPAIDPVSYTHLPSDVAVYVERGAADVGIVGKDILLEQGSDVYELLDLGIGKCRMAVAGIKGTRLTTDKTLRVATKFPNIAREYFRRQSMEIEIIKLHGSIEIAPILHMSDVIVDIVETGTTLKENNLEPLEDIVPILSLIHILFVEIYFVFQTVIDAFKCQTVADGPCHGCGGQSQRVFQVSHTIQRIFGLTV